MIRLVVQIVDTGAACNVGGPVHTEFKTFDIDHAAVELLLSPHREGLKYRSASVIGVEVLPAEEAEKGK